MSFFKNRVVRLLSLIHSIKEQNLDWHQANQGRLLELTRARKLADKQLEAELAKKNAQLAHEIALLKLRQNTELTLLKTRCKDDLKDYQSYLESLNQLKETIQSSYSHLPEAITLTIHHHAKSLLNRMWEADNLENKILYETQLLRFMATFHEEARLYRAGSQAEEMPKNTLGLISLDHNASLPN